MAPAGAVVGGLVSRAAHGHTEAGRGTRHRVEPDAQVQGGGARPGAVGVDDAVAARTHGHAEVGPDARDPIDRAGGVDVLGGGPHGTRGELRGLESVAGVLIGGARRVRRGGRDHLAHLVEAVLLGARAGGGAGLVAERVVGIARRRAAAPADGGLRENLAGVVKALGVGSRHPPSRETRWSSGPPRRRSRSCWRSHPGR